MRAIRLPRQHLRPFGMSAASPSLVSYEKNRSPVCGVTRRVHRAKSSSERCSTPLRSIRPAERFEIPRKTGPADVFLGVACGPSYIPSQSSLMGTVRQPSMVISEASHRITNCSFEPSPFRKLLFQLPSQPLDLLFKRFIIIFYFFRPNIPPRRQHVREIGRASCRER